MCVVHFHQPEHNNCTMVRAKTAKLQCSLFGVQKLHYIGMVQLWGVQHVCTNEDCIVHRAVHCQLGKKHLSMAL